MKDMKELLREGDPVAREPEFAPGDVARIARLLREHHEPDRSRIWAGSLVLTAAGMLMIAAVVLTSSASPSAPADRVAFSAIAAPAPETRQLQFATPGGTRIIWVFDPDFEVR